MRTMIFKKHNPIMIFTKASRQVLFHTQSTFSVFSHMISTVFGLSNYLKVGNFIVKLVAISMVYDFSSFKKPSYTLFDNKAVFSNVTKIIGFRMFRGKNKFISRTNKITSLVIVGFITTRYIFNVALSTISSFISSLSLSVTGILDRLSARNTFFSYHYNNLTKRT